MQGYELKQRSAVSAENIFQAMPAILTALSMSQDLGLC